MIYCFMLRIPVNFLILLFNLFYFDQKFQSTSDVDQLHPHKKTTKKLPVEKKRFLKTRISTLKTFLKYQSQLILINKSWKQVGCIKFRVRLRIFVSEFNKKGNQIRGQVLQIYTLIVSQSDEKQNTVINAKKTIKKAKLLT